MVIFSLFFSCGENNGDNIPETVTDIDGKVYHTITIGSQVWLVENLNVTHYRNGDPINHVTDNITWSNMMDGAFCHYDFDINNANSFGKLYNWFAVNDSRGIAPEGFRVATEEDWNILAEFSGGQSIAGKKLKEAGDLYWFNSIPSNSGTNEFGFSARGGGYMHRLGFFQFFGGSGLWWTSSEYDMNQAITRSMYCSSNDVGYGSHTKGYGCSVRCIMN